MNQLQIRASEADDDPRVKDAADKMKANLKECQWSLTEQYLDSEEASRRYQECIDQITFNDGQFRYLPKNSDVRVLDALIHHVNQSSGRHATKVICLNRDWDWELSADSDVFILYLGPDDNQIKLSDQVVTVKNGDLIFSSVISHIHGPIDFTTKGVTLVFIV